MDHFWSFVLLLQQPLELGKCLLTSELATLGSWSGVTKCLPLAYFWPVTLLIFQRERPFPGLSLGLLELLS
ncbi:hypothetical protein ACFX1T_039880 [Malus domestica]